MNIDSILTNVELNPIRKVNLPCDKCDGDCCGMIPMSKSFLKDMWKKHNLVKKCLLLDGKGIFSRRFCFLCYFLFCILFNLLL